MKDTVVRITFFVSGAWEAGWEWAQGFVFVSLFLFFWLGQKISHIPVYPVLPKSCAGGSGKKKKKE